ncbi:MAG: hypothetical protein R3E97_22125 [Candidatus Eisenbacteria bacterium]
MFRSFLTSLRSAARPATLLVLSVLSLTAITAWTGCGEDPSSVSGPSISADNATVQVIDDGGYTDLPPEAQEKVDLVVGIIEDLLSEQPDVVAGAFARLDDVEPGLYDQVVAGLVTVFEGDGFGTFQIPIEIGLRADDAEGGPTICTKITVTLKLTIHKGSKICYESGGIEHCTELHRDTVITYTKTFEFECEAPEGCTVEHGSTTTVRFNNKKIEYQGPDNDGNGTPDFSCDIKVSGEAKVVVEVSTCE